MPANEQIRELLEAKYRQFNVPGFIEDDPISIPHRYNNKADIEIAGFFAATLAWGQRKTIINSCIRLMEWMDDSPYQFILHHTDSDLKRLEGFVHRTFQPTDLLYFIDFLKRWYAEHESLEEAFQKGRDMRERLISFHHIFFDSAHAPERTRKHVATPERNSSCKRLNMFLRWMVRRDESGVDLGIWDRIPRSDLVCPFDVHVGRVSRSLGLVGRKQNDWKAAMELTMKLREFDPEDPCKYDLALFGLGIEEKLVSKL